MAGKAASHLKVKGCDRTAWTSGYEDEPDLVNASFEFHLCCDSGNLPETADAEALCMVFAQ